MRRGFAGAALAFATLALALPALAKETPPGHGGDAHGQAPGAPPAEPPGQSVSSQSAGPPEGGGPPSHAGPPDGADGGPPPHGDPPPHAGPPPHAAAGDQPAAAAEPGPPGHAKGRKKPKGPKKGHPHGSAASESAPPATPPASVPAPPAVDPPAPADESPASGKVRRRSTGEPDFSEPVREAERRDPQRDRAVPVRTRARIFGTPRTQPAVPPAVAFRRAVQSRAPRGVAVAAPGTTPAPQRPSARTTKARPVQLAPAQPLPARVVPRPVRRIVEVVPGELWAALGALALLALALGISSWLTALRARRLRGQREALLQEVGLLQAALLPSVPDDVDVSVAYRPADGATAGGDFYEVFALAGGRTAIILGDVSGHGRDALSRTTFVRYTLRAYLEAGLEPREVLKVGAEALAAHFESGFATVTVAVHDPSSGRFTYACAGHAPPVVVGPDSADPVTACSAPPVGVGEPTGFRQSTFTLTPGSRLCMYTDGVTESRIDGRLLGVDRVRQALEELPADGGAEDLLDEVEAIADEVNDDMAVCLLRAADDAAATGARIEEFEVDERDVGDSLEHFLRACGVPLAEVPGILREAGEAARREGTATVRVRLNDFRPGVDVVPGNLVRLEERRRAVRL